MTLLPHPPSRTGEPEVIDTGPGPNQWIKDHLDGVIDAQFLTDCLVPAPEERLHGPARTERIRMDIRKLDRAAVLETLRVLDQAVSEDWDRPTPCTGWTLRQLVSHMTAQHHGFTAAAAGNGADVTAWRPGTLGDDPLKTYRAAAESALSAFAGQGVLTREFTLPEISDTRRFPAEIAIGFHFLDHVVHGWDLARTIGVNLDLDAGTAEAALAIALHVPNDERRLGPDAAFRPALPPAPGGHPLDLILTTLGRSPDWSATPLDPPQPPPGARVPSTEDAP
ncbi:TIGR03086 family metal-binding protein [Streptomyces sp. NPDC050255]|uniref:TIGR03086 family metal-binding protein n=1 Tax=Streptomyces sp. NPDC050255 TaxID=3365606 RepID=UPI0037A9F1C3